MLGQGRRQERNAVRDGVADIRTRSEARTRSRRRLESVDASRSTLLRVCFFRGLVSRRTNFADEISSVFDDNHRRPDEAISWLVLHRTSLVEATYRR